MGVTRTALVVALASVATWTAPARAEEETSRHRVFGDTLTKDSPSRVIASGRHSDHPTGPVVSSRRLPHSGHRHHRDHDRMIGSGLTATYRGKHVTLSLGMGYPFSYRTSYRSYYLPRSLGSTIILGHSSRGRITYVGGYSRAGSTVYYWPDEPEERTVIVEKPIVVPPPDARPVVITSETGPRSDKFESSISAALGEAERVGATFALGESRLRAGKFKEAVDALKDAEDAYPGRAAPKIALALAYIGDEQYWGAIRMLRRGVRLLGGWEKARLDPAQVFGDKDTYVEVRARLGRHSQDNPDDADLLVLLAYMHFLDGELRMPADYLKIADQVGRADELDRLFLAEIKVMIAAQRIR